MKNVLLGLFLMVAISVSAQKQFRLQVEKDQGYTSIKDTGTKVTFDEDTDSAFIDLPFEVHIGTSVINKLALIDEFDASIAIGVRDSFAENRPFDILAPLLGDIDIEPSVENNSSGIYYKKDSVEGEDVFTLEWYDLGSSDEKVNYQIKFFKDTKRISYCYGVQTISSGNEGFIIGLVSQFYNDENGLDKAVNSIFLSGDSSNPTVLLEVDFEEDPNLVNSPALGTVYTFTYEESSNIDPVSEKEFSFNVHPNPASDVFSLGTDPVEAITMIRIVDMSGRVVQVNHSNFDAVDVSSVAPGTYIVEIITTHGTVNSRLVIAQK